MSADCTSPVGIYIHVPFCRTKCPYCDFYSITDLSLRPPYLTALVRELQTAAPDGLACDSLYIGGGTPSLYGPAQIGAIIDTVAAAFDMRPAAEITLEVNPGTVTSGELCGFREAGVNRLSIGVQSFFEENLRLLGRSHTAGEARQALDGARRAGFSNLNVDLIYGLPGQRRPHWHADLRRALSWAPEHLACYLLTYERGTPLERRRRQGRHRPLDEADAADLFRETRAFLAAEGYTGYEVSNFARATVYRARHNSRYWRLEPYLGFGAAAHSFVSPRRWWNVSDVGAYIAAAGTGRPATAGSERLDREQQIIESVALGLRCIEGIAAADFKARFGLGPGELFGPELKRLQQEGLVRAGDRRLALSGEGFVYLDAVVRRLIEQL